MPVSMHQFGQRTSSAAQTSGSNPQSALNSLHCSTSWGVLEQLRQDLVHLFDFVNSLIHQFLVLKLVSKQKEFMMARKTFISYKYSEAKGLRDKILKALGDDATYYQGETADSPDLTDQSTETIKEKLKDMMYTTSVTIVVVSPNFKESKWIDWEIEYCLKEISRQNRTSKTNGVVGIIQEIHGGYDWLVTKSINADGCNVRTYEESKLYSIINNNRYNRNQGYACDLCMTYDQLNGSYISFIDESEFLADYDKYIENAFDKSEKYYEFDLTKQR